MSLDEARQRVRAARSRGSRNSDAIEDSAAVSSGSSELIVSPLAGLKVRPVKYLVPGRIPLGKLILFGGRGGSGKSTLLRRIAADLSAGRCCFGLSYADPIQAKVLILPAEDGVSDTVLPHLLAEGADITRVAVLEGVRKGDLRKDFTLCPEHVELVRDRLAKSPDIKLIILDPIASFVGRAKIDDHRATELRRLLDPLSALAESTGTTIAMIAHLNKGSGDAVDRFSGSAAYRDSVRAAYVVAEDPDDSERRLLMPVKENLPGFVRSSIPFSQALLTDAEFQAIVTGDQFKKLGPEDIAAMRSQLHRVRFDAPLSVDPNEAMKAKRSDGTKVQKCKEWLRGFLKQYAYPSNEILEAAKANGFTFDHVKNAKSELKDDGVLSNNKSAFAGGWWSGLGNPSTWTARPEPFPSSPPSSSSTSSTSSPSSEKQGIFPIGGRSGIGGTSGSSGTHQFDTPDHDVEEFAA